MNRLQAWKLHSFKQCADDSRICRYCHPEKELAQMDYKLSRHKRDTNIDSTIHKILSSESRYRNKFLPEHIKQLQSKRLLSMITSRLTKRLKTILPNDGKQTPYIKHAIDVACHTCATCCRYCVSRWHKI